MKKINIEFGEHKITLSYTHSENPVFEVLKSSAKNISLNLEIYSRKIENHNELLVWGRQFWSCRDKIEISKNAFPPFTSNLSNDIKSKLQFLLIVRSNLSSPPTAIMHTEDITEEVLQSIS